MATIDQRGATVGATDPPIGTNPNPDLAIKAPVRVATTGASITLAGLQTIDGVALAAGDRVLVKDQADATTNGIYVAQTGNWQRSIDAQNNSQWAQGMLVLVAQGTLWTNAIFELTSANPIVLGTTALTYVSQSVGLTLPLAIALGGTGGATKAGAQISLGLRERLTADRTYYVRTPPVTVTLTLGSPGLVNWTSHGLAANAAVVFNTTGSLPTGLTVGAIYYVVGPSITANAFEVSATQNGSAINFTVGQSGTQTAQTGSDSNSGLNNTASGALLTIQRYVTIVNQLIDLAGNSVFGQLAHGQYNENVNVLSYIGRGSQGHTTPSIQGDAASPTAVVINAASGTAINGTDLGSFEWVLKNLQINAAAGTGVNADEGSWMVLDGVTFGACVNAIVCSGGVVEFQSPCTWAGNMVACGIQTANNGVILDNGGNAHIISGNPGWGFAFAFFRNNAQGFLPNPCSFTGASTGTRWSIDASSFVDSGGTNFDTLFPGNANGSYSPIEVRRGGTGQNVAGSINGTATNDNANPGCIGEFVSSTVASGSAVALASGVAANVTSISLTAGDWDVWIAGVLTGGATTTLSFAQMSISTTSATLSGVPGETQNTTIGYNNTPFNFANHFVLNVGPARKSFGGTTTVYLVANASFGVSTCSAYGAILARRRR